MFTPAITASSVSPPALIISIAFSVARSPFLLEMTTGIPFEVTRLSCAAARAGTDNPSPAAAPTARPAWRKCLRAMFGLARSAFIIRAQLGLGVQFNSATMLALLPRHYDEKCQSLPTRVL